MNKLLNLPIAILYVLLAYISYLELELYKSYESKKNNNKFIYKPYKILIYFSVGLIYLINYYI